MSSRRRIVICGGGAVGAAIAYFVSRGGAQPIVIERHAVAGAASGKSGGFLALDWCVGTPLDRLARRSFTLHAALKSEVENDWGHRPMSAYGGFVVPERDARRHTPSRLNWLADGVIVGGRLGTEESTAIVHPRKFTTAMMNAALAHGAALHRGQVTG